MNETNFIDRQIIDNRLKVFLLELFNSSEKNENILCYCILIELKNELLEENFFVSIINEIEKKGGFLNFSNFIENFKIEFDNECKVNKSIYSRIVNKDTFETYVGSFAFNTPKISEAKIKAFGWSTGNGVVWITPKKELNKLIQSVKSKDKANTAIDYVGFPRDIGDIHFIKIDYSPNFDECVFQSNSSNAYWWAEYILFLSFKKDSGYGLTYNDNGVIFAKEQVHKKSYYYDDFFEASYLGKTSKSTKINDTILEEAKRRFYL